MISFLDSQFVAKAGATYQIMVTSPKDESGDFMLALESGLPRVIVMAKDAIASESRHGSGARNTANFLLTRTGPTRHPLRVRYFMSGDEDARERKDYFGLPGYVTIPAGRRSVEVVIKPIDDREKERTESVRLRPGTGMYDYVAIWDFLDNAEINILDND